MTKWKHSPERFDTVVTIKFDKFLFFNDYHDGVMTA